MTSSACHGEARYCLRTYDDFTFAETHNAYSTIEDQILVGVNHYTGLQRQWDDGIRAFMVDSHHSHYDYTSKEDVVFCHAVLASSSTPATSVEVDAFEWMRMLNSLHEQLAVAMLSPF